MVLWCNWLALRTLNPAIRVQVPVGPLPFWRSERGFGRAVRPIGIARDTLAEWLRRVIRNHMGFPRAGSNPAGVATFVPLRRLWSRGYDVRFPTVRPGFESRRAQALESGFDPVHPNRLLGRVV